MTEIKVFPDRKSPAKGPSIVLAAASRDAEIEALLERQRAKVFDVLNTLEGLRAKLARCGDGGPRLSVVPQTEQAEASQSR